MRRLRHCLQALKSVLPQLVFIAAGLIWIILLISMLIPQGAHAQVPPDAHRYRADLVRNARLAWGIDAPIAVFAAQIHQESAWRADAVSPVGARGMAQFMPSTERWIAGIYPSLQDTCSRSSHSSGIASSVDGNCPSTTGAMNPVWAIRALVTYDLWLWDRLPIGDPGDRMWAVLRAYNGGIGHWQAESRNATTRARADIDAACGTAKRHPKHCAENLNYPRRIMTVLQPRYQQWGGTLEVKP